MDSYHSVQSESYVLLLLLSVCIGIIFAFIIVMIILRGYLLICWSHMYLAQKFKLDLFP